MKENSIAKLSLLCSLIGMVLIYFGSARKSSLTPISQIDKDFVGLKVKISGQVLDLAKHAEGHLFLKVKDSSDGVISVPIFAKINSKLEKRIELLDNIQIKGIVEEYNGELEVLPEKAESIQVIHSTPFEISKINKKMTGELVKIQGTITRKKSVGKGSLLLKIKKNNGEIKVYIPSNVSNSGNLASLHEGQLIRASGLIQTYKKELELKVEDPYNLKVVGAPDD
ncbi:hypothetical protein AKJ57_00320 [candidate division MSBL1 archaeon SCGC-AAA259A05]|uniref:OB domain-containing protein n=1 Tax=candidate division MSBL1 archaeon SCGC-AAA259A05 TaxID=1698259 RepID=A0A133UBW1_9EURY|nr:hypothetical protein AKJ57_00320 [candidate division MSBL1 archaeon SCGC-AAA259A05]